MLLQQCTSLGGMTTIGGNSIGIANQGTGYASATASVLIHCLVII